MPSGLRVQCAAYNGNLGKNQQGIPDLRSWLTPTLSESDKVTASNGDPPDIYAIGFEEILALNWGLLGLTRSVIEFHTSAIHKALESDASQLSGTRETYTLITPPTTLGGIALMLFTRDSSGVSAQVKSVEMATAGTGIFRVMGNKGAVGARVVLKKDDRTKEPEDSVYTFVVAHLAAHDHNLKRRNEDYQAIVERLVFKTHDDESNSGTKGYAQMYDTSYLFFFGDLNYRISNTYPKKLTPQSVTHKIHFALEDLFPQDQLGVEKKAGRTLHGLREGAITFKPTYKFKTGTTDEQSYSKKRTPSWCDRILFSTWADGSASEGSVELYRSVPSFGLSDHKPVTAIISLPSLAGQLGPLRLSTPSPYPLNSSWRSIQLWGKFLDKLIGSLWTAVKVILSPGGSAIFLVTFYLWYKGFWGFGQS